MPSKDKPRWMEAKQAFLWVRGARQKKFRTAIVRDRHSGRLSEVALTELPPLDEGSEGEVFCFAKGERVLSDHPAVIAKPHCFIEAPEVVLAERR